VERWEIGVYVVFSEIRKYGKKKKGYYEWIDNYLATGFIS
jgi:hypothetical protein